MSHLAVKKLSTVKPVLNSKRTPKVGFQYQLSLNAGQKYCRKEEHSAILSYHFPLRPWFCPLSIGRLRLVLLYLGLQLGQGLRKPGIDRGFTKFDILDQTKHGIAKQFWTFYMRGCN